MRIGKIGRERERAVEACERLIVCAGPRQRHAKQDMRARPTAIDGERLARMRDPVGKTPLLAGGECQTVKLIGLGQTIHAGRHWFEAFIAGHTN